MKIGILGSACDPPHKAHIKIGEYAKKFLGLDRIILIPTNISPHKNVSAVAGKLRLAMARLAIKKLKGWSVSDMELKRRGISYTKDTIRKLKKLYPRDELFWIVGSDAIVAMEQKWKGGYKVLDMCKFIVFIRPGYPLNTVSQKILKKVIVFKKILKRDLSSTMLRHMLKNKKSVKQYLVPEVLKFVKQYNLYL